MRALLTAFALLAAPMAAQAQTAPVTAEAPVVSEARAFMASYATDLATGNREALMARYDLRGTFFPMDKPGVTPFMAIGDIYGSVDWQPPASFEWVDLSYEALSGDSVVVTGAFLWGRGDGKKTLIGYTGLLVRQDGVLRIRVEHESLIKTLP